MGELRSAWEIAQEKANRLGKLSAEEKEQQDRQKYRQIGQMLVQKWLDDSQRLDIAVELEKYEEQEQEPIRQAVIDHLVDAIEFTIFQDMTAVKRIIGAISSLQPELQPKAEEIGQLAQEYEEAEYKIRHKLESDYRETLHQLRISGTAIDAINIEASPRWQSARRELVEAFTPRLNGLKQAFRSNL